MKFLAGVLLKTQEYTKHDSYVNWVLKLLRISNVNFMRRRAITHIYGRVYLSIYYLSNSKRYMRFIDQNMIGSHDCSYLSIMPVVRISELLPDPPAHATALIQSIVRDRELLRSAIRRIEPMLHVDFSRVLVCNEQASVDYDHEHCVLSIANKPFLKILYL